MHPPLHARSNVCSFSHPPLCPLYPRRRRWATPMASPASFCFPVLSLLFKFTITITNSHDHRDWVEFPPHLFEVELLQCLSGITSHILRYLLGCVRAYGRVRACDMRFTRPSLPSFSSSRSLSVSVSIPVISQLSFLFLHPPPSAARLFLALFRRLRSRTAKEAVSNPPVYATPRHAMSSCTQIYSYLSSFVLVLVTCSEVSHSFSLFSLTHS
jgi:hypothetical protein